MTKYDLKQWQDKSTTIAAINIAEAKFATWRTRILLAAANKDAVCAIRELLVEMLADSVQLWISGFNDSLKDCVCLYNKVWNRLRMLFRVEARTDILERDGFMEAVVSGIDEFSRLLHAESEKESTE